MQTLLLLFLTALALVAAQASGLAVPVALTLSVAWGLRMYWQHDWLTREGMAEMATPCVLGQGLALAVMVALLGDWPLFCAAASIPLQVVALRALRARLPVGA